MLCNHHNTNAHLSNQAFFSLTVSKRVKSIMCETIKRVSLYACDVKCTWFTSIACVLSANITFQWTVINPSDPKPLAFTI